MFFQLFGDLNVKLVFVLMLDMALLFIWHAILQSKRMCDVQKMVHRLPRPLPFLLQWPVLMFISLVIGMSITMEQIITDDLILCNFLDQETMTDHVMEVRANLTHHQLENNDEDIDPDHLRIPYWLKMLSITSPFVGSAAFILCFIHIILVVYKRSHESNYNENNKWFVEESVNKWEPSKRQDMVLLVIGMPAVFIVMCVRSTGRMWMVMGGFWRPPYLPVRVDMALFRENLEAGCMFQYYTVFAFSRLCMTCLQSADKEMRFAMKYAGFQGVYAFCLIGMVKAVVNFSVCLLEGHKPLFNYYFHTEAVLDKSHLALDKIDTAFSVVTLLCIYNMAVICRLKHVKKVLGNANVKFLATRLLILLSQVQLKAIDFVVLSKKTKPGSIIARINLSQYQGYLLHSSLLTYECFLLVLLNLVVWTWDVTAHTLSDEMMDALLGEEDRSGSMKSIA